MLIRFAQWSRRNLPTRETFERIGWLRPVAHLILRPELWRFHRRSVPRGVALGVLVGVLIPVAQTIFAAFLALPARANVPVAALTTFITNPFTTPPIWAFAYWIGRKVLVVDAATTGGALAGNLRAPDIGWAQWLLHDVGPALGLGLIIVSVVGAILGYILAAFGWRWWIAHKWRTRRRGH
jgi:hypothetical protein